MDDEDGDHEQIVIVEMMGDERVSRIRVGDWWREPLLNKDNKLINDSVIF